VVKSLAQVFGQLGCNVLVGERLEEGICINLLRARELEDCVQGSEEENTGVTEQEDLMDMLLPEEWVVNI
jgi:hypothetical protein